MIKLSQLITNLSLEIVTADEKKDDQLILKVIKDYLDISAKNSQTQRSDKQRSQKYVYVPRPTITFASYDCVLISIIGSFYNMDLARRLRRIGF